MYGYVVDQLWTDHFHPGIGGPIPSHWPGITTASEKIRPDKISSWMIGYSPDLRTSTNYQRDIGQLKVDVYWLVLVLDYW